jgi:hypothetical protein
VRFLTLHDTFNATKRHPEGDTIRVRADAIDTLRGYPDGLTRCILGVHGAFHHVAETEDEILEMLKRIDKGY